MAFCFVDGVSWVLGIKRVLEFTGKGEGGVICDNCIKTRFIHNTAFIHNLSEVGS